MERKASRESFDRDKHLVNQRSSSKIGKRENLKTIISNQNLDGFNCARSIHLKPDLIFNKVRSEAKLIPTKINQRNKSIKQIISESDKKLPELGVTEKRTLKPQTHETPMSTRRSLTRRTLAGSSLSRVYHNPQFTPLNQIPYIRPATVYPDTSIKQPPKIDKSKVPWVSTEIGSITRIKVIILSNKI